MFWLWERVRAHVRFFFHHSLIIEVFCSCYSWCRRRRRSFCSASEGLRRPAEASYAPLNPAAALSGCHQPERRPEACGPPSFRWWCHSFGEVVGVAFGDAVGTAVGDAVGNAVVDAVGDAVGIVLEMPFVTQLAMPLVMLLAMPLAPPLVMPPLVMLMFVTYSRHTR